MDRDTARPIDPKITAAMDSHVRDRDTARTALIEVMAAAMYAQEPGLGFDEYADAALDALAVARQDVPCETCGQYDYEADAATYERYPIGDVPEPCPTCHGTKSVSGPLLIDVMMGRQ